MSGFILSSDDVVSIPDESARFLESPTATAQELMEKMQNVLNGHVYNMNDQERWVTEGISCKVLRVGAGWQSGKVRLRLEFVPDTPESPLDA